MNLKICGQMHRKKTLQIVCFFGVIMVLGLPFRAFVSDGEKEDYSKSLKPLELTVHHGEVVIDNEVNPKPLDFEKPPDQNSRRAAIEKLKELYAAPGDFVKPSVVPSTTTTTPFDPMEAFTLLENDTAIIPSHCRRPLPHLWTQSEEALRYSLFPSCKRILDAALHRPPNSNTLLSVAKTWPVPDPHNDTSILELVSDCKRFRRTVDFPDKPLSKEEAEYPLAYVFVPFRNLAQTVRLFRMLYHPQNAYCITYDMKCKEDYVKAILAMASCFPSNVYVNPNPEPIYYSTITLVSSVMTCFDMLRQSPIKWKYVQIVSWNDFPLKTNLEMVQIFKALNGSQDSELMDNNIPHFVTYQHSGKPFKRGRIPRPVPPDGVTIYKGSYSTTMSREFIDFMLIDPISTRLYDYFNGTQFPDEFYWATLIHNVQLNPPGGFPGQCLVFYTEFREKKPFISRFQVWEWDRGDKRCHGKIERGSCVFGVKDLAMLIKRKELIAHKLYDEYQPALLYCLEEWYWQVVCMGEDTSLDIEYYETLPSVVYHNLSPAEKQKYVCEM